MNEPLTLRYDIDGENFTSAGEASVKVKKALRQLGFSQEIIRRVSIAMYEGEINMVIHANGGEIEKTDEWGRKKLAYPIDYKTEVYYVLVNFAAAPELPRELERNFRNDESILRYMVVRQNG